MQSLAMLIPADLLTEANAIGAAMGYGPESFTIPCGDGETVTHYAGYLVHAEKFMVILAAAAQGILPQSVTSEMVAPVLSALVTDVTESDDSVAHMESFLAAAGLQRM